MSSASLNPLAQIGRATLAIFTEVGRVSRFAAQAAVACVTPPWFLSQLVSQLARIGYFSLPVIGLTAVFIGAALALNIYVGGARFNAESFVPNIVVLGITRELGPVLAGLMLAGRVSAGIAGVILIEARKDVTAPISNGHRSRVLRDVPAAAKGYTP